MVIDTGGFDKMEQVGRYQRIMSETMRKMYENKNWTDAEKEVIMGRLGTATQVSKENMKTLYEMAGITLEDE